ncbi:MAG: flagellar hook-associated protein FlgL [Tepidisphaeraceae bacterium]|jgi:flagellar hook-associated protein 3 FlgL
MAILPIGISRVSNLLQASLVQQSVSSTQSQMLQVENELSTGKRINTPSDDPAAAATIGQLNNTLTQRKTYSDNITAATSQLSEADSTLGDLTNLLQQAQEIASANVGSDVTSDQRQSAAAIVQSIYDQVLSIGNKTFNNMYLFAGDAGASAPFAATSDGVLFQGSATTLKNAADASTYLAYQVSGAQVFGSLATGVTGDTDISPQLTAQTRLTDISGTSNDGIRLGSIQISDGSVTKVVDLSSAQSIGDVVRLINQAGVGSITASISGQGLTLTGSASENISVQDVGGTAAADLGIATGSGGAGVGTPLVGADMNPRITAMTLISDLRNGSGIDNAGLVISNGTTTKTITWSPTATVQDVLNDINGAGLGLKAQIDASGAGLQILNATQGTSMSIAENGGQTATQLGIRTFSPSTLLTQLNGGKGVNVAGGSTADFQITRADGTTFTVSLGSAKTVQDVIDAINTADGGGGVTASFSTTGNGIVLTDTTGGSGTLSVSALNNSTAAADLGLDSAPVANVLTGKDVGSVQSTGIFSNLQALINGLNSNDQDEITTAGSGIQADISRVTQVRGQTGAVEQELSNRSDQITQENTATQSLISQLQDTDMTTAITQYQTLQTALQASLQTAATSLNLSLLDFLA